MNGFSPGWVLLTYTVSWSTSQCMKKVPIDVEAFAAKIADKQDNPTMHELAKSFPEKTYRELELYRDSDRKEEANRIPLTESQKKQEDLEPIEKGVCVTGELRKAREKAVDHYEDATYRQDGPDAVEVGVGHNETIWFRNECKRLVKERDKEHKLRQEAEGELSIMKGIETNRVKEAQAALANALEVNESHQKFNGKLQMLITELEQDNLELHAENKKMHKHLDDRVNAARKGGM